MRSKSVTNSYEFFICYEEFVRIIHTCEKYEVCIKIQQSLPEVQMFEWSWQFGQNSKLNILKNPYD